MLQIGAVGGQILQQFRLVVEVDHEGLVLLGAQNAIEEPQAGGFFLTEHAPLAHAGIHQQTQRQRQVGFVRKVLDDLRAPVFEHGEVVLAEHGNHVSLFIAHGCQNVDNLDVG